MLPGHKTLPSLPNVFAHLILKAVSQGYLQMGLLKPSHIFIHFVCMRVHMRAMAISREPSEDNFPDSVLSFHHVGPGDQTTIQPRFI